MSQNNNKNQPMSKVAIMMQQLEEMFTKNGWTRVRDEKPKERTYEIISSSKPYQGKTKKEKHHGKETI